MSELSRLQTSEARHSVLVVAAQSLAQPSRLTLPVLEEPAGLLAADGSVNWGCPCLGGMATGPCAHRFRDAFSCFHYSTAEPKGSDCYEKFADMQQCMANYPQLYGKDDPEDMPTTANDSLASPKPPAPE